MPEPTLDIAVVWKVWLGNRSAPVLVLVDTDAPIDDVARVAKVAELDQSLRHVREEHREYDEKFWTDEVASADVTKIERADEVYLSPRIHVIKAHDYPLEPAVTPGEKGSSS